MADSNDAVSLLSDDETAAATEQEAPVHPTGVGDAQSQGGGDDGGSDPAVREPGNQVAAAAVDSGKPALSEAADAPASKPKKKPAARTKKLSAKEWLVESVEDKRELEPEAGKVRVLIFVNITFNIS